MSALLDIYIKKETLQKMLEVLEKKSENGIALTVSVGNEANQYGQNVSCFVSQSKEHREAKKPKFYVGNGKVFWNDGKIENAVSPETMAVGNGEEDDLPF